MKNRIILCGLLMFAVTASLSAQAPPAKPEFPKFEDVAKAVSAKLASRPGYKTGDILSVRDVEPVFAEIEKLGWKVADRRQILAATFADNDYLVAQLRTPEGVKMQRKIGMTPMSYDYLDRLRSMPHGSYRIRELIDGPDGYKMIQYMTSTPYGNNMAKMLDKAQNGQGFTKPTGRIYNEPILLNRLQASYDAEVARRDGKTSKAPSKAAPKKN